MKSLIYYERKLKDLKFYKSIKLEKYIIDSEYGLINYLKNIYNIINIEKFILILYFDNGLKGVKISQLEEIEDYIFSEEKLTRILMTGIALNKEFDCGFRLWFELNSDMNSGSSLEVYANNIQWICETEMRIKKIFPRKNYIYNLIIGFKWILYIVVAVYFLNWSNVVNTDIITLNSIDITVVSTLFDIPTSDIIIIALAIIAISIYAGIFENIFTPTIIYKPGKQVDFKKLLDHATNDIISRMVLLWTLISICLKFFKFIVNLFI